MKENWSAYFVGGAADLTKRAMPGWNHLPPYFEVAIYEPLSLTALKDDAIPTFPRDSYVLRYADERSKTAIYIFDRRITL